MVVQKIISHTQTLKEEFKKQTSTAIMAAFGLIIALSWKDVITDGVSRINFLKNYGLLATAVFLTIISIIGILLVSKWANYPAKKTEEKKEEKK